MGKSNLLLNLEALLGRVIADPTYYLRLIESAAKQRAANRPEAAREQYRKVVNGIQRVQQPERELLTLLGQAYLAIGDISQQLAQPDAALVAYRDATALIEVEKPVLKLVATSYAAEMAASDQAISAYLRHIKQHSDSQDPEDIVAHFLEGQCEISEGAPADKVAAVANLAGRIIQAEPNFYWAHYALGVCLKEQGDYDQAITSLTRAADIAPNLARIPFQIGRTFHKAGNQVEAIAAYRRSLVLDATQPEALYQVGILLAARAATEKDPTAKLGEAAFNLSTATSLAPERAEIWHLLGKVQLLVGQQVEACSSLTKAADLAPRQVSYQLDLAGLLTTLGDDPAAIKTLKQTLDTEPSNGEAHFLLGELLLKIGTFDEAETHYRAVLAVMADHDRARAGLGRVLYHQDRFEDAAVELKQVRVHDRHSLYALARSFSHTNSFEEGEHLYREWIATYGPDVEISYYHGCALAHMRRDAEALAAFDQAEALAASAAPMLRGNLTMVRGVVLSHLGKLKEAEKALSAAEKFLPQEARVPYAQATLALRQNKLEHAGKAFSRVVELDPSFAAGYAGQGVVAELRCRFLEAISAYTRSLQIQPNWEAISVRLAVSHAYGGNWAEALGQFEKLRQEVQTDEVRFQHGLALANLRLYKEALLVWEDVSQTELTLLRENQAAAHYYIGRAAFDHRDYLAAIHHWKSSQRLHPNQDYVDSLTEAIVRFAAQLVCNSSESADITQAVSLLDQARTLSPDDTRPLHYLALARIMEGKIPEACNLLSQLLESAPDDSRSKFLLAVAELQQGHLDLARPLLNDLVPEMEQYTPALHLAFGKAALLDNQPGAAFAAYSAILITNDDPARQLEPLGANDQQVAVPKIATTTAIPQTQVADAHTSSAVDSNKDEAGDTATETAQVSESLATPVIDTPSTIEPISVIPVTPLVSSPTSNVTTSTPQHVIVVASDGSGDFSDLAQAVAQAQPGTVIRLRPASYTLTTGLVLTQPISFVGEVAGAAEIQTGSGECVINYNGEGLFQLRGLKVRWTGQTAEPKNVVMVTSGQVAIENCYFAGATSTEETFGAGIQLRGMVSGEIRNCETEKNTFGIIVGGEAHVLIEANNCHDNFVNGILVTDTASPNVARNVCIKNKRSGLSVDKKATPSVTENICRENSLHGISYYETASGTASGNSCQANSKSGIYVGGQTHPLLNGNGCTDNQESGIAYGENGSGEARNNRCTGNSINGVYADGTANPTVGENVCSGNKQSGIACFGAATPRFEGNRSRENGGSGFYLGEQNAAVLLDNICEENEGSGILCCGECSPSLEHNTCIHNLSGILVAESAHPVIDSNTCQGNQKYGIEYENNAAGTARNNNCSGNEVCGIAVEDEAQPVLEANSCQSNSRVGMAFLGTTTATARKNICVKNSNMGILVSDHAQPMLHDNLCNANEGCGIGYRDEASGLAQGNTCTENSHDGIWLRDKAKPDLQSNTCQKNGEAGIAYYAETAGQAVRNKCEQNVIGIWIDERSRPQLLGNTCSSNKADGISVRGEATPEITSNLCDGNLEDGIYISETAHPTLRENLCQRNRKHDIFDTRKSEIESAADALLAARDKSTPREPARLPIYILVERSAAMEGEAIVALTQGLQFMRSDFEEEPRTAATAWLSVISFSNFARVETPLTALEQFSIPTLLAETSRAVSFGAGLHMVQSCLAKDVRTTDYQPMLYVFLASNPTDAWQNAAEELVAVRRGSLSVVLMTLGPAVTVSSWAPLTTESRRMDSISAGDFQGLIKWVEQEQVA